MRINTNKINKVFENLNNKSQIDSFLNQRDKDSEVIYLIPFTFEPIGTANTTEAGIVSSNFEIDSFTSYAKLITGINNIQVKWDEAYNVFIDEEANKNLADIDKYITKEYRKGRVIRCNGYQENTGSNTIPSPVDSSFKQIEIVESLILKTKEKLKVNDILKVYLIPQKNKWRWLYIPANGLTEYYDKDNNYIGADITLMSVNSLYSTSGGAIEQFIQKGAPGEGYAFPKWNDESQQIELDEERAKDIPVQAVQREYSGAAAFNTIYCYGRPTIQQTMPDGTIQNVFNPKIKASRLLLPYKVQTPNVSPINTKPSAETDYYLAIDAKPTLNKYYKSWKEQFQANYDLSLRAQYEGVLELPKVSELETTNPIYEGTHQYILWDTNFQVRFTNKEFNTQTNKLAADKIVLNGAYSIAEIMAQNSFITNHLITLPMTAQTNTTWNLHDIPLIGGFLNTLTLGIPIGWTNTKARVQMGTVMLLTPANLVKYGNQLIESAQNSLVPFDLLQENKADLITNSGIAGMGSSIKLLLTDEFTKNGVRYNTVQLGQRLPNGDILKWDGTCKPVAPTNTSGYVIDVLVDRTISKTDCRTVFYSSQYEAYQSTYKTKSKFTGEIRDWTNEIRFSSWNATNGTVRWPEIIQQPNPPQIQAPIIEISDLSNETFKLELGNEVANNNFFANTRNNNNVDPQKRLFRDFRDEIGPGRNLAYENFNDKHYPSAITLKSFTYDYTAFAPNINQLSFLYDYLTISMFGSSRKIPINDLIGGAREAVWLDGWNATIKYRINYTVPTGSSTSTNKNVYRKCKYQFKVKLIVDALTELGKIKFDLVAYDISIAPISKNIDSDTELQIIYEFFGGSSGRRKVIQPLQNAGGAVFYWFQFTDQLPYEFNLQNQNNITQDLGQNIKANFSFRGAQIRIIPRTDINTN